MPDTGSPGYHSAGCGGGAGRGRVPQHTRVTETCVCVGEAAMHSARGSVLKTHPVPGNGYGLTHLRDAAVGKSTESGAVVFGNASRSFS